MMRMKKNVCSICKEEYIGIGNNANPFPGICCDDCNTKRVIPARLLKMTPRMIQVIQDADIKGKKH